MGAFGGHYDVKQVVVVDMDVDIDDPNEIEWAIATRFQADRDLVVVSGAQGSKLDPSSDDGISAKMGIDATKPLVDRADGIQAYSRQGHRKRRSRSRAPG